MSKNPEYYVAANRAAWNKAAHLHEQADSFAILLEQFAQPGFSVLDAVERKWLQRLGVEGRAVAQLACNNARELLSVANMGAVECVGFDLSREFLAQGQQLARAGGIACTFVETDLREIEHKYDGVFDRLMITIGVLGWMPVLSELFDVCYRLLKPGGKLFVHEEHPVLKMMDPSNGKAQQLAYSYFDNQPFEETELIVYDDSKPGHGPTHYWFAYTFSQVLNACVQSGLTIQAVEEFADNISSAEFDLYENQPAQLPLSYALVAAKP